MTIMKGIKIGHANAKITLETYVHLVPNEDNDLAEIFEKELEKSREHFVSIA